MTIDKVTKEDKYILLEESSLDILSKRINAKFEEGYELHNELIVIKLNQYNTTYIREMVKNRYLSGGAFYG